MKERDFYRPVQNWVRSNLNQTAVIELKLVKEGRFRLSDMRPHQLQSLSQCKHNNMVYKIPDAGYDQKPFDICYWNKTNAYIGVIFYEPRKKKNLYLIDIDSIVTFDSSKVSYSEEELSQLAAHRAELTA
jgi:hypothetical protein